MVSSADLKSWTSVGSQESAQRTYASVKQALDRSQTVKSYDPEIFLQGSYANHTNTRGDSDVDIVVMMKSSYMPDVTRLSSSEIENYERSRIPATSTIQDFRQAVQSALEDYYGYSRVNPKNKCIRVDKRDGYVDADVVPAMQHRLYTQYPAVGDARWVEGIAITPLSGRRIVNYPKEHINNGQRKNLLCSDRYKPTVRQIKRLRRAAVDAGLVGPKEAPGYLLECLVFNAPRAFFDVNDAVRVSSVLGWLKQHSPEQLASGMKSGDEIHMLFDTDPGNHNEYTAHRVLQRLWDFM